MRKTMVILFYMYRSILGKCSGRELGKTVKFCTIASQTQFQNYLIGGNLYVFFNLKDEDSPYQLWKADYRSHFQFMNNQNKEGENLKCDSIKYLYDKNLIDLDNKLKTECGFEFKNDGVLRTDNLKNFVKDFIALGHNNPTLEMFFNIFGGIMSLNKIHLDSKSDKKYRAIDKSIVFITYEVAKEYMGIDKSYAPIVYDLVIDYYSKENMPATTYRAKKDEVVQMIENNEIPDYVMDTINTFLDEQR